MVDQRKPTVKDFRLMLDDPMVILGRALAPLFNAKLEELDLKLKKKVMAKPGPNDYCPGCGELSSQAPDLCSECLELNTGEKPK